MFAFVLRLLRLVLLSRRKRGLHRCWVPSLRLDCAGHSWAGGYLKGPTLCLESTFHTRTVWSFEPVANFLPLQLQSKQYTFLRCATRSLIACLAKGKSAVIYKWMGFCSYELCFSAAFAISTTCGTQSSWGTQDNESRTRKKQALTRIA